MEVKKVKGASLLFSARNHTNRKLLLRYLWKIVSFVVSSFCSCLPNESCTTVADDDITLMIGQCIRKIGLDQRRKNNEVFFCTLLVFCACAQESELMMLTHMTNMTFVRELL